MKKLLAILISLCMVSAFAVPVFADANSDYIAAVKAYQAQIAAKEAAYTAAVDAYSKNAKAKQRKQKKSKKKNRQYYRKKEYDQNG